VARCARHLIALKAAGVLDVICCGDLILDEPDPERWLSGIAAPLQAAALAIGHLEVPHTTHVQETAADIPAPGAPPAHLDALARAGIDAVTLAGNHISDCGAIGIADTIAGLERLGIAHCGAGANLSVAREPAVMHRDGTRIALLSYNCVGPEQGWATEQRAGCAYVRVDPESGGTIAPAASLVRPDADSVACMADDIRAARADAHACIVALHKGIVHTPARLAPYERQLAQAAIDAGADAVIGHHAHILRGIEFYQGRPIFHGLGNGCVVTRALSTDSAHPQRAAWARRRRELFGFEPDPSYPLAPFHPEAVHGMLARLVFEHGQLSAVGFVPVFVEPPGRPVCAVGARASAVCAYVATISGAANLPALRYSAEAGMVRISPA
jgi:poly-gamma-glutamate capsule biosynthesis protein CapA/YwtB (metallophosphatase superfamily)